MTVEEELVAWELAMNINPSDGHIFGYTVGWSTGAQIGEPDKALTKDYLDSRVWSSPANYIAIVRHQEGVIDAFKVFKFKDGEPSLLTRFGLDNMNPGRQVVTEGGPIQESIADYAQNIDDDPIFAVGGDLAFNWIYSNNGNRITLTGGHLSEADSNDDNTRGIGNTIQGNVKAGIRTNDYYISDVTRAAGTYRKTVQGTDHGVYLNGGPAYGNYAIFVSTTGRQFPKTGTMLSHILPTILLAIMGEVEYKEISRVTDLYLGAATGLVSFLTTLFNGISLSHLLLLLKRDSSKGKNSTTILYINLGVCDLLQGLVSSFSAIALLNNRVLPACLLWLCPVSASCVEILPAMGLFITMYVLGIKCVVFYMPLRSKQLIRYKSTLVVVVGVWLYKLLYSLSRQVLYGSDYWSDLTVCVAGDYFQSYNFIFMGGLTVNLSILFTLLFTVALILKVRQRHADRQALMRAAMQAVKKTRVTVSKFPENFVAEVLNPLSSQAEPIILQCFTQTQPSTATINVAGRKKHKHRVRAHSVAYTTHPLANNPYNLPSICSSNSQRSTPSCSTNAIAQCGKASSWNNITASQSDPTIDLERCRRGVSVDSTTSVSSRLSSSIAEENKIDLMVQSVSSLETDGEVSGFSSTSSVNMAGINSDRLSVTSIDLDGLGRRGSMEDIRLTSSKYRSLKNYLQKKHSLVSIASIASKRPSRVSSTSIRPNRFSIISQKRHSLIGGVIEKFRVDSEISASPNYKRHSVTLVSFIDGQMSVSSVEADSNICRPSGLRPRTFSAGEMVRRSASVTSLNLTRKPLTKKQVRRITKIRAAEVHELKMVSNPSIVVQNVAEIEINPQQGEVTRVPEIVLAPTTPTNEESPTPHDFRIPTATPQKITLSVISPSVVEQLDSPETDVSATVFSAPSSQQYLHVGRLKSSGLAPEQSVSCTNLSSPEVPQVLRSPAREQARQQRLARRRASANNQPKLAPDPALLTRQKSDQTGLRSFENTLRQNSDSSAKSISITASRQTSCSDQSMGSGGIKREFAEEGEPQETTARSVPISQSVDVIALKYSTLMNAPTKPNRPFTLGLSRRTTIAVDTTNCMESPLRLSSNDLTYGTETERDIEAAQTFIQTHQQKDQPHIIPMWNKRPERSSTTMKHRRSSNSVNKGRKGTKSKFIQSPDGEGGFDPLLRRYERPAPYFIDSSHYPSLVRRTDPLAEHNEKARRKESRAEQNVRKDFVLLGLNLGGGFIKRNVNKSLQKKMQLRQQDSSGKSRRALKTSILVALNITIFYSLFFYVWLIQTVHRFTNLKMDSLIFDLNNKIHILGPLYIIFLPTLSSLLDPVIYFCNKSGVKLLSEQGSRRGHPTNQGVRQRRVGRVTY
ncbi:hypothetical protein ACHWQZ_G006359 [Mnemiopsis leidyi]